MFSCSQRLHLQPTATLPSTRLQGGARGLRARSAVGAEAGAFPTTIGDSVRVHSPQGACYVFDISRYLTGCRVALGTLVVSISRLTPTNILRICYDSCIYILYDAQV